MAARARRLLKQDVEESRTVDGHQLAGDEAPATRHRRFRGKQLALPGLLYEAERKENRKMACPNWSMHVLDDDVVPWFR